MARISNTERSRRWRERNPTYQREWRARNPDKTRGHSATYKAAHRDEINARNRVRMRKWRNENRELYRARMLEWARKNPEKVKDKQRRIYLRRYGLTTEQVQQMARKQRHRCLICKRRRPLHVDHCHATGRIRGLLCGDCNRGIGLFRESRAALRRAIAYLNT